MKGELGIVVSESDSEKGGGRWCTTNMKGNKTQGYPEGGCEYNTNIWGTFFNGQNNERD